MKATRVDSIRSYLTEIVRIPMLSPEQEIALGRKVQRFKSLLSIKEKLRVDLRRDPTRFEWAEKANCSLPTLEKDLAEGKKGKNHLVVANLRLVVSIAKKYQQRGLELLDLIQEGNTGLIVAASKFNPKKGCKFSTVAHWWIRQAIVRAIQNQSRTIRLPVHTFEKLNKIKKAYRELSINKGRTPKITEIAKYCAEKPETISSYLKAAQIPFSLDQERGEEEDLTLGNLLEDKSPQPLELLLEKEQPKRITDFLAQRLTTQEQEIVILRHGLFSSEPETFKKIGVRFGITREGIRQKEKKAIAKLKKACPVQSAINF